MRNLRKPHVPIQRAWDYLLEAADYQLLNMPAQIMGRASALRTFIAAATKYRESRPCAIPGMSVNEGNVLLWVSEAPGGLLASISLPTTAALVVSWHRIDGAMIAHYEDQRDTDEEEAR